MALSSGADKVRQAKWLAASVGSSKLPLSAEHRVGAGVAAGDEVDVEVELETQPREAVLPADFAEALGRDEQARRVFEGLSYSAKQRFA